MSGHAPRIRPAAVAGTFYPSDPHELHGLVRACITGALLPDDDAGDPKALVVPHAGLVFSGPVAASAYLRLLPIAERITRVVLLGPSHRVAFRGIAASSADAFATPLGLIPIDTAAVEAALELPCVAVLDDAHAREHSLEVQLPFLQSVVPHASLVPFVVGDAATAEVGELLERLWGGPETLIVISTDLSHFHPQDQAMVLDRRTAAAIVAARPDDLNGQDACGVRPLRGLLQEVRDHGMAIELIDLRTSADTAGDPDRVVGYGAFAVV